MAIDLKRSSRPDPHAGEAARVGEELRDARVSLGVSLEETAEQLRINKRYLTALEEGRVRDLPGAAYATGFVRTYATAMGLDADELVRRFRDGAGSAARSGNDLVFPEPVPERGVPAGAVILVGAVLVIGAYVGWYQWSGSGNRTVDAVPPLPARLEETARQGAQLPALPPAGPGGIPAPAAGAQAPGAATSATAGARPAAGQPPVPAAGRPGQPAPTAATPPPVAAPLPAGTLVPSGPAAVPAPAATATPPAPAATAAARINLRAQEEAWVQIRDPRSGQVLMNRVLRAGETFQVPPGEGLLLTTGRAQSLEVVVDGQPSQVLAGRVGVVRDVALTPDTLRAARPPAR
ncbi:helix-turn-helix domain-containing protein [Humitalea sp. 24SJ18S-53]|uniref:helix-turn-helix domain-containing protein n=1 Tax=Humitalea sp. 24SJ18S-53 TaxID=3422307 RepID=UPI003D66C0A7